MIKAKFVNLLFILFFGSLLISFQGCKQMTTPQDGSFGEAVRVFSGQLDDYNSGEVTLFGVPEGFDDSGWNVIGEGKIASDGGLTFEFLKTVDEQYLFNDLSIFQGESFAKGCKLTVVNPKTKYLPFTFIYLGDPLEVGKVKGGLVLASRPELLELAFSGGPYEVGDILIVHQYANGEGIVSGTCEGTLYDLNYKLGWNLMVWEVEAVDANGSVTKAKSSTKVAPEEVKWFLLLAS